ncbi:hypothetical protein G6F68_021636 [Rhizopus microsporus]|nr:hypothetical protein G6F68_021636 [Rhizopus microsporus]
MHYQIPCSCRPAAGTTEAAASATRQSSSTAAATDRWPPSATATAPAAACSSHRTRPGRGTRPCRLPLPRRTAGHRPRNAAACR